MNELSAFLFVDDPAAYRDGEALLARIPAGTRGKRELLTALAKQLAFPAYFGGNWDALSDCLRDLSWLPECKRVVIVHNAMPLHSTVQRQTYLEVLRDAATSWRPGEAHELLVIFPMKVRLAIDAQLAG